MSKEMIGLDIGAHSIKLVGLRATSQGFFLSHAGIKEIPYGEEAGEANFIGEVIKALYRELGLNPGKVRLVCSGPGLHIRRITLPSMPKAELKEAIRWEMKGQLPLPVESIQTEYYVLGELTENEAKKLDLIIIACPKTQIERTLAIAAKAGLRPTHLGVAPFALWNALENFQGLAQEEGVALIDIGAEKTGIYILQDRILQFSREITPAGTDITQAVQEGLDPGPDPHLLHARAEKIKRQIGIPLKGPYPKIEGENISLSKLMFAVRPVLEKLAAEIGRSLDYYRNHIPGGRVDRLLLTGGGASLKNMDSYLADELHLPVERFNPLAQIPYDANKIASSFLDEIGPAFTMAAGTALGQPKKIELLPVKEPFIAKITRGKTPFVLAASVVGLIFFGMVWNMNAQLVNLKKDYETKMAQLQELERMPAKLSALKEKENLMKRDLKLFSAVMEVPFSFQEVLQEIRNVVPANVTLTLLDVQPKVRLAKEEAPPVKEGKEIQISGLAFGNNQQCLTALAQMIEHLEKSSLFRNVKLVSAEENKLYTRAGIQFEMVGEIDLEGRNKKERP